MAARLTRKSLITKAIFYPVQKIIDYDRNMAMPDGQGIYFIRTIYVSFIHMMVRLIVREYGLNDEDMSRRKAADKKPMKFGHVKSG
ncbi:hypothetical protein GGR57DRAFT_240946 [Xylariaceae sp. FL1272]|nr:hypothetical protein GGR57DRAFT_240946 [Xylariaceae sp. FL1272]